ncbi:TPA: hypothetical protein DCZ31_03830 [Patescibacteria group bacterium]|nr:hypothetical protein [Candidatus Gracilibacteria bacterium]
MTEGYTRNYRIFLEKTRVWFDYIKNKIIANYFLRHQIGNKFLIFEVVLSRNHNQIFRFSYFIWVISSVIFSQI